MTIKKSEEKFFTLLLFSLLFSTKPCNFVKLNGGVSEF